MTTKHKPNKLKILPDKEYKNLMNKLKSKANLVEVNFNKFGSITVNGFFVLGTKKNMVYLPVSGVEHALEQL